MNQFNLPLALQTAVQHHQNGQLSQAKALYQQVLQADPDQPDALQLLGLIEHQQGHSALAVELICKAIKARPHAAMYHFNLGNTLQEMGQLDPAIASYRQALSLQADFPQASYNLGNALSAQGRPDEAIASYQQTLKFAPGFADNYLKIGNALLALGRFDEAIASYRQMILQQPDYAEAHFNLGNALIEKGWANEAIASYRQALTLRPDDVGTLCNYAKARMGQGQTEEAVACYRQATLFKPDEPMAYSGLLFALQNLATCNAETLFQEHLRFAKQFEVSLMPTWRPHANLRDAGRRLKLGYVSGDFCDHPVAYFLEPILSSHDKSRFEVYAYSNNPRCDSHTERIQSQADHWLVCSDLSDAELADRIRADGIDILVDLAGHTAHNRLLMFARKPAPVQCTYIGYPGSTGLSSIDYRISDPWQDPPSLTERFHSEKLVRIPGGMAFTPYDNAPAINALPALTADGLVFACLNNMAKVSPAVIHLWARILRALPQARLLLGNVSDSGLRQHLTDAFGKAGVDSERLILQPRVSVTAYLALHHQIDLALDPFPYNGGTTTMHSLWMGVPVITLAGDHAVSRLCAAHLARVGLNDFITHTEDDYLQCAIRFACDLPALNQVRQSLRARMNAAECNPATITRQLEAAYREMWQKWCHS